MPTPTPSHEVRLRRLAERLGTHYRAPIETWYDSERRSWTMRWYDGPSVTEVRTALDQDGTTTPVLIRRDLTTRALALAAIRETRAGAMRRWVGSWGQRYHLEQVIGDRPHPERTTDPREQAMLDRLLAAATTGDGEWAVPDESRAFDLIARDGIAWLLPSHRLAAPGETDGLALDPLEFLTARYADGVHRTAWETALTTMPLRTAITAAQTDPSPTPDAAHAALTLLPTLRAQITGELDTAQATLTLAAKAI
ncbi:hypothetical protein [Kitasatospora sp. GP82]|uniref:hypothetical protein n=1 Tax=Kitasatospora sp. GP82 TaxID=3035089 RepID=UPI002472F589|nr:hypothetical protein [Kitasatospora sp. GP82]MDH6130517.1 hypothetical protein [Kitasatospora sp. GP82]